MDTVGWSYHTQHARQAGGGDGIGAGRPRCAGFLELLADAIMAVINLDLGLRSPGQMVDCKGVLGAAHADSGVRVSCREFEQRVHWLESVRLEGLLGRRRNQLKVEDKVRRRSLVGGYQSRLD